MKRKIFAVMVVFLALSACSSNKKTEDSNHETAVSEIAENEQDTVIAVEAWQETDDAGYLLPEINEERSIIDRPETKENAGEEANKKRILTDELCTGVAKDIFEQINAERTAQGIEPLLWDDELARCAEVRANEIITNFSHVRADGTKCYVLSDLIWGENIARGPHATGAEFVEHWMASEGHKANILQPKYTTTGIGVTCTEQGDTAVQLFGVD